MTTEIPALAFQIFVRYAVFTMAAKLRYRGRDVTDSDIAFIAELIAHHPGGGPMSLTALCALCLY